MTKLRAPQRRLEQLSPVRNNWSHHAVNVDAVTTR
jgi:hypothetical protein